jgi:cell division protein FtsL
MNLELEKKKLERKKVAIVIDELQFKIMEREADIARIKEQIGLQETRIEELNKEISDLKE